MKEAMASFLGKGSVQRAVKAWTEVSSLRFEGLETGNFNDGKFSCFSKYASAPL